MTIPRTFSMKATVWLYPGNAAWHFASVPVEVAEEIRFLFGHESRGWGSLPVIATIGNTSWKTSIFPDKKTSTYLLPLKADVRKKEGIAAGNIVSVNLDIRS